MTLGACIDSAKNHAQLLFHTKSVSDQHMLQTTSVQQQKLTSPGTTNNKNAKVAISKSPNSKKTANLKQQQLATSSLIDEKSSIFVKTQSKNYKDK